MRSPDRTRLVVATRGSRLALVQTETVCEMISAAYPGLEISVEKVTTTGDRDGRAFAEIGGKGLFTSEVERAVVSGAVDIAVHSAKDLTSELAPGCAIVCIPARAPVHDVVVGGDGATGEQRLASLRPGALVGTSSMRRRALLAEVRGDVDPTELRGNLDTRLAKVTGGSVDAAIVAAAGLHRLGRIDEGAALDPDWWVPAPAQGALAVEALVERTDIEELLVPLADVSATAAVTCERAFAARLEGGCSVPLGCLARGDGTGRLVVTGYLGSTDAAVRDRISGPASDAVALGRELADALLASGGDAILADARAQGAPEVTEP